MFKKIFMLFLCFFLIACSSRQTFVANKATLDPFSIYAYQTLALPPIYYLSAKEISDDRRFTKDASREIENLFFSRNIGSKYSTESDVAKTKNFESNFSLGEKKLLELSGANKDFKNIKEKINQESLFVVIKEPTFIKKLFSDYHGEALDDKFSEYSIYNKK
jgi:hypothetical protein